MRLSPGNSMRTNRAGLPVITVGFGAFTFEGLAFVAGSALGCSRLNRRNGACHARIHRRA